MSCSKLLTSSPSTCPVWATRMLRRSALRRRYCRMRQLLLACSSCSRSSCSWYTSSSWNMSRISSISQRSSSTSSCNRPHRNQQGMEVGHGLLTHSFWWTLFQVTQTTSLVISRNEYTGLRFAPSHKKLLILTWFWGDKNKVATRWSQRSDSGWTPG